MKASLLALSLTMMGFCATAMAAPTADMPVEIYTASGKLDVAKILSTTDVSDANGFVRERLVYQDSKGHTHVINYGYMKSDNADG